MQPASTASIDRPVILAAAAVVAAGFFLAVSLPITTREALAFTRLVRPPLRDTLGSFHPSGSLLNVVLLKRAVGLFRLSAFSIRVPELAGLALCLWALARLSRGRWMVVALSGAAYVALEIFTRGATPGLGLALWLCALERRERNLNLAGLCLGLSVAANFCFLLPALILAAVIAWLAADFRAWTERLLATGVVTAFLLLVLPFSHAGADELLRIMMPPAIPNERSPRELLALAQGLEREARGKPVRIAAPADVVPVLEFYRARDRAGDWRIFTAPAQADYYVQDTPSGLVFLRASSAPSATPR